jgi:hypothetical protein
MPRFSSVYALFVLLRTLFEFKHFIPYFEPPSVCLVAFVKESGNLMVEKLRFRISGKRS